MFTCHIILLFTFVHSEWATLSLVIRKNEDMFAKAIITLLILMYRIKMNVFE